MAGFPIPIFIGFHLMKVTYRMLDGGLFYFATKEKTTKKTTITQYVTLHSGILYAIHAQYASIIVQVLVSFMFGMALPILFPITLVGIFTMYCSERLQLCYNNPKPPMYGKALNDQVQGILKLAPFLMMIFGYWIVGNKQIFDSHLTPRTNFNGTIDPQHPLIDFKDFSAEIFLLALLTMFFTYKLFTIFRTQVQVPEEYTASDEKLSDYWCALSGNEQKNWYATEVYVQNSLGIRTMDGSSLENLRTRESHGRQITDTPNYNILGNQFYITLF